MGNYLNPGNEKFQSAVTSAVYVDKTELIGYTNRVFGTEQKYICVSRPRRFGKSMAANMLAAYYSRGCDSEKLFQKLKIAVSESFHKYINQYDTLFLNMQEFLSRRCTVNEMIERIKGLVLRDLKREYPDADYYDDRGLVQSMQDAYQESKRPFVVIIDEWIVYFANIRRTERHRSSIWIF